MIAFIGVRNSWLSLATYSLRICRLRELALLSGFAELFLSSAWLSMSFSSGLKNTIKHTIKQALMASQNSKSARCWRSKLAFSSSSNMRTATSN